MRRREFVKLGGGALLSASVAGTAAVEAAPAAPKSPTAPPSFVIDSHNHWGSAPDWVEQMVTTYRRHNSMACTNAYMRDMTVLKAAAERYPDVFIPYGRVMPDDPNTVREIEVFHDNGFRGIKFHRPFRNWDDPAYFQLYRLAEQLGLHMLFHTGISSRTERDDVPRWGSPARMRPMYLYTIAQQFPRATIQGAHFGNPWYEEAAEAMRWSPNLYFDLTGSTLYKLVKLNQMSRLSEYIWWADWPAGEDNPHTLQGGPSAWEHIVFGVDEGPAGLGPNIERMQLVMDANNVPAADREKIWSGTMARILKIEPARRRAV